MRPCLGESSEDESRQQAVAVMESVIEGPGESEGQRASLHHGSDAHLAQSREQRSIRKEYNFQLIYDCSVGG